LVLQSPISKAIFLTALGGVTVAAATRASDRQPLPAPSVMDARDAAAASSLPASSSAAPLAAAGGGGAKSKTAEPATTGPCGAGMVLVDGEYCPDAEQVCLKWLDPPPYQNTRCGEYAKPSKCKTARQHRRFCIDKEEYVEPSGADDALPVVGKKWGEAKSLCEARGARLCKESEWEFACEGPEMTPYPYGYKREPGACNVDRTDLGGAEDKLTDHRAAAASFPQCTSSFGVHHLTGNVDEWVERENGVAPNRSALRGGWWLPGRNRCRAATLGHDETYAGKQVGFRCCKDAPPG